MGRGEGTAALGIVERVVEAGIIAILRGLTGQDLERAVDALLQGGIEVLEVALNTPRALEAISNLSHRLAGRALVGAGTVLAVEEGRAAVRAGAAFLITPHVDEAIIQAGREEGIPVLAGAMTPTEIVRAYRAGSPLVKLFPAGSLGPRYLALLRAPLPQIPLVPVGGVDETNAAAFFEAGAAALGVGGSLVDRAAVREGRFEVLYERARRLTVLAAEKRSVRYFKVGGDDSGSDKLPKEE